MPQMPRPEYPRPDFERKDWICLNGEWEFSFDKPDYDKKILVPFCYQAKASGIDDPAGHDVVWYRRGFAADPQKLADRRLLLHFGAVDYHARVWVNGAYLGEHRGGHTPFCFDIGDIAKAENELVVMVTDYRDIDKPRGKQTWRGENFACWYTPTTGIWQSVWLEYAGASYLRRVKITPDTQAIQATCEVFLSTQEETAVELSPSLTVNGEPYAMGQITAICRNGYGKAVIAFTDFDFRRDRLFWTPEHPNLVDVRIVVKNESGPDDEVFTYFGMRSAGVNRAKLTLNGDYRYQRLVLDQGYWPDSLLTPPSDEAIIEDIKLTLAMGFNGARKHQKIEDPRYYYWADKLGLLVWGEMPSAFLYNDNAVENTTRELIEFVERDYNHPSIVAWVPINESWGVRGILSDPQKQDYCRALIYLIKSLDNTRPISGNDGWEQPGDTDLCCIHDYALFGSTTDKYDDMQRALDSLSEKRYIFADGNRYGGQPLILSEYGGIAFAKDSEEGWGYYGNVKDEDEFFARLNPVNEFLMRDGRFSGYCYTQLTDVMQEVNGLLREDRTPKVSMERLYDSFSGGYRMSNKTNSGQ